jgi:hypothetical protein
MSLSGIVSHRVSIRHIEPMGLLRCFLCFLSFLQMYRSAPILIRWIQHTREKRKGLRGRISNFENRGNCGSEAKTDENHETENYVGHTVVGPHSKDMRRTYTNTELFPSLALSRPSFY